MQLRSDLRDPDPAKDRLPTHTSFCQWRKGLRCQKCDRSPNCAACESVESYVALKGPLQCKRCQRFGHTQRNCGYAPHMSLVWLPPLRWMLYLTGAPSVLWLRWKPHSELPWLCEVEAKAAVAKQAPERSRKIVATGQPATPKAQRAGPSAEQIDLGEGCNHVVRGGVSSRPPQFHPPTHILIPLLSRSRRRS